MSGQIPVKRDVSGLAETARAAAKRGLPPVHQWNPPFSGDMDMVIRRDGTWVHEGGIISRPAMVRLFSTILKREGDAYFLVTPVEKVGITVEDVPFIATDFEVTGSGAGQAITFQTNVGDTATAGADHPIRVVRSDSGEPAPYVMIRAGLEARIDRKSFYRLVELGQVAQVQGTPWFGVRSGGAFFPMIPSHELD